MSTPKKSDYAPKQTDAKAEIDFDALVKAIKDVLLNKKGSRPAAREYNVPRATLERHIKKVKETFDDVSAVADCVLKDFVREKRMKLPTNMVKVYI